MKKKGNMMKKARRDRGKGKRRREEERKGKERAVDNGRREEKAMGEEEWKGKGGGVKRGGARKLSESSHSREFLKKCSSQHRLVCGKPHQANPAAN